MSFPSAPSEIVARLAFGSPWSRSTRLLTTVFLGCCAAILGLSYSGWPPSVLSCGTLLVVAASIVFAIWWAPNGYELNETAVLVRRRAGAKSIPLATVKSARLMEPAELAQSTWRWPAAGGWFGFYGTFETPALGRHQWYASRDESLVLLQTAEGPVVLSPDRPEVFVREVNQRLRRAGVRS